MGPVIGAELGDASCSCTDLLHRAGQRNVRFMLTSDAHHADELARVGFASLNVERVWVDPARVLNAGNPEQLKAWLRSKAPLRPEAKSLGRGSGRRQGFFRPGRRPAHRYVNLDAPAPAPPFGRRAMTSAPRHGEVWMQ